MNTQSGNNLDALTSLFSNDFAANPFPMFQQMRAIGAVVPIPFSMGTQKTWMVTQFQEAVRVLKDDKRFVIDASTVGNTRKESNNGWKIWPFKWLYDYC